MSDDRKEAGHGVRTPDETSVEGAPYPKPNYNVHIFYYPWYGNPESDGQYIHWNHLYLKVNRAVAVDAVDGAGLDA